MKLVVTVTPEQIEGLSHRQEVELLPSPGPGRSTQLLAQPQAYGREDGSVVVTLDYFVTEDGAPCYVCDSCGTIYFRDEQIPQPCYDWACEDCGSGSAWEFTDRAAAEHHAKHIQRGLQSGIFRPVNPKASA